MAEPVKSPTPAAAPTATQEMDLAPGWVTETVVIWTQFPARKGILDLSNRKIPVLPEELYRMRKLEELIMVNNLLTEIPGDLAKLAEAGLLRKLDCGENKIHTVHPDISEIQSLETIKLPKNQLSAVPVCIPKLMNLVELDLSYNQLYELTDSVCNLIFLERLILSHNQIPALPKRITSMGALRKLHLDHNCITELPKGVENWKRLLSLRLNHNQMDSLPDEVGFLITLDELAVNDNPFRDQPEIIEKNLVENRVKLIKYLRSRIRAVEYKRMLLFTEKDNNRNTRFEVMEGDEKPTLTGATPEKLAVFLTQVSIPDAPTLTCVEKCYTYFMDPPELLWLFVVRYKMTLANPATNKEGKKVEEIIQGRIIYVVLMLLKKFNQDKVMYPPDFITNMRDFIDLVGGFNARHITDILTRNESVPGSLLGGDDQEVERERAKRREKEERERKKHEKEMRRQFEREKKKFTRQQKKRDKATERMVQHLVHSSEEAHILSYPAYDIATQMCLLDSEKFAAIPETEFLQQKWTKPSPELIAPNITSCIDQFNNLSNWATTWIVRQTDMKTRLRTIQHLLDIAGDLLELGDFSALFAIGSAMSCAPVTRLKETFALLDEKRNSILQTLHQLTDNTGNYKFYKEMLKLALQRGHAVPHLAIYLKNFTFTEEGNPNFVEESDVINLAKYRFITLLLEDIAKVQPKGYQYILDADAAIQQLILEPKYRIDSSNDQYEWSLKCEASKRRQPTITTDVEETSSFPPAPTTPAPDPPSAITTSQSEITLNVMAASEAEVSGSNSTPSQLSKQRSFSSSSPPNPNSPEVLSAPLPLSLGGVDNENGPATCRIPSSQSFGTVGRLSAPGGKREKKKRDSSHKRLRSSLMLKKSDVADVMSRASTLTGKATSRGKKEKESSKSADEKEENSLVDLSSNIQL